MAPLVQALGASPSPSSRPPLVRSDLPPALACGAGGATRAAGAGAAPGKAAGSPAPAREPRRAIEATRAVTEPLRSNRTAIDFQEIVVIVASSPFASAATVAGTPPASTAAGIPPADR